MKDAESLIRTLARKEKFGLMKKNFTRIRMHDIFFEQTGLDLTRVQNPGDFNEQARSIVSLPENRDQTWDTVFFILFLEKVEPELSCMDRPVILYDFPVQIASLAKPCLENPEYVERFEVYIRGIELCNGYTELEGEEENRIRFSDANRIRKEQNKEGLNFPEDLQKALQKGFGGFSSGVALGMDRLCMLLTGQKKIRPMVPSSVLGALKDQKS